MTQTEKEKLVSELLDALLIELEKKDKNVRKYFWVTDELRTLASLATEKILAERSVHKTTLEQTRDFYESAIKQAKLKERQRIFNEIWKARKEVSVLILRLKKINTEADENSLFIALLDTLTALDIFFNNLAELEKGD